MLWAGTFLAQALLWKCGHTPKGDETETRLLHGLRLVSSLQLPSFKILGLVLSRYSPDLPRAASCAALHFKGKSDLTRLIEANFLPVVGLARGD